MNIDVNINIHQLLQETPESMELLYPFTSHISANTTIASLAKEANEPVESLLHGIHNTMKRCSLNPCNYAEMRNTLIKPGAVNVAGFVSFLWHKTFIEELKKEARKQQIELNLNIFPKHAKKKFQNYLALCTSPDDLPDILIGKGFSSLVTQSFIDRFVTPGHYKYRVEIENMGKIFSSAGLADPENHYHPFAIEETIMLCDQTATSLIKAPSSWDDLLKPEFKGTISQMGKNQRDHFGFVMLFYLYASHGIKGIEQYARNVESKKHFTQIIKSLGNNNKQATAINIIHQFAGLFIPSDLRHLINPIHPKEGNPVTAHYFLIKNKASNHALRIAKHLYSKEIKDIVEKCGASHITSESLISLNMKIRWIGWQTIKKARLPYLKEYLSDVAYNHFQPTN